MIEGLRVCAVIFDELIELQGDLTMKKALAKVPHTQIEDSIRIIRNERVILDADLADLYGVENRALIQSVKRNLRRFPPDFLFELTKVEFDSLRSQIVISK